MTQQSFDPNAIRIEDIFQAKRKWRMSMANLPFEEKIEVVKQLKQIPRVAERNEKLIFSAFLESFPELSRKLDEWDIVEDWYRKRGIDPPAEPFSNRPDIIAKTHFKKVIGIELKSWLNYEQIADARKKEKIQERVLKAFRDQPPNETKHVDIIVLYPNDARFSSQDADTFREQVLKLVYETDYVSSRLPSRQQRRSENVMKFDNYPLLAKYLKRVEIKFNTNRRHRHRWILGPSQGSHFSPDTMRQTLKAALLKYRDHEKYKDVKSRVGLDEVYLLVHYDFRAFAYNTPFAGPEYGFTEVARFAADVLSGNAGCFDRVFLFQFLMGQEKAYEVAPEFRAVSQL